MATVHGIPLLSGSPPTIESDACRKCNKEFNLFFTRSRKCNHCGYSYCHSCSDFQALLPRSGSGSGYDSVHVCGYCIELLNVTAAGPGRLRGMLLSKLKTYASSYNIDISRAVEKNDIIEAILHARGPNGCLPQSKEDFYRKNKVPNPHSGSRPRGFFSRSNAGNPPPVPPRPPPPQGRSGGRDIPNPRPQFPQPQPQPPHTHYQPSYGAPPQPQGYPYQPYTPHHQSQQHYNVPPHHNFQHQPPPSQPPPQPPRETRPRPPSRSNSANRSSRPPPRPRTPPRQRTTSSPPQPHTPPAPVPTPTLDQLLVMTQASIAALSVSVLKSILFMNHVNVTMVLEKSELVKKVVALVDDEKRERERQRLAEEAERFEEEERRREREEAIRREEEEREERLRKERQRNHRATVEDVEEGIDEMLDVEVDTVMDEDEDEDDDVHQRSSSANSQPRASSSPKHSIPSTLERSGLCVICQDEEANIAIVDCGHMVMCRACSELIMHGSKECPLCRTRIVTEARLLRIFKS